MKKLCCFLIYLLCAIISFPVLAADKDSAGNVFEDNQNVSFEDLPFFSAFAFGETVTMNKSKAVGSVAAAAKTAEIINSDIGESLYIGGETVDINDTMVGGNIFSCGRHITVSGKNNGLYCAGESLDFDGDSKGVYFYGSTAKIKGRIDGDAIIHAADDVIIDEDTQITGSLKVVSKSEPVIPEGASIGNYRFEPDNSSQEEYSPASEEGSSKITGTIFKTIYLIIAMSLLGIVICKLFDEHLSRASELIKTRKGTMIARGIAAWILIPIIAVLLLCTLILAPVGAVILVLYILMLCVGVSFTGASLGRMILPNMNVFLSSTICIAVIEILKQIPYLGILAAIAADVYLLAYVITTIKERQVMNQQNYA